MVRTAQPLLNKMKEKINAGLSSLPSVAPLETEEESRSLEKAFLFHLFLDSSFLFQKRCDPWTCRRFFFFILPLASRSKDEVWLCAPAFRAERDSALTPHRSRVQQLPATIKKRFRRTELDTRP